MYICITLDHLHRRPPIRILGHHAIITSAFLPRRGFFAFHTDFGPPRRKEVTRSAVVTATSPFARDPAVDYDYDSDEERYANEGLVEDGEERLKLCFDRATGLVRAIEIVDATCEAVHSRFRCTSWLEFN